MISFLMSLSAGVAMLAPAILQPEAAAVPRAVEDVSLVGTQPAVSLADVVERVLPAPKTPRDKLCSLESSDLEFPLILKALSEQTKVNLILLGGSNEKLTVRLKNVKLGEMLDHLCALANLGNLDVGSTIVIAPDTLLKEKYPKEWVAKHGKEPDKVEPPKVVPPKTVTRVYRSNFVDANLVGEALLKMFPQQLTVSGVSTQLTPRMGDRDTAAATGVSSGILKTDGQARPSKLLVVRGPEDIVDAAMEIAKEMDFERPQVGIAVTIHDISNDALKDLGLTWEYGKLQIEEQEPRGINFGSFSRVPFTAVGTIRALERADKAKLLASPNVSVLDGESAFILIGNRINFPVLVGFSQANTPIFDKQEERVGIYLQVSASVSNDGQITLSLYPQVSTVTGFLEVNGASYPQISTREAQTTLRVKSGETIVMGGMLKDEELSSVEKVPLLSQIPILGELFTHRKKTKSSSQVIISITPAILESNP